MTRAFAPFVFLLAVLLICTPRVARAQAYEDVGIRAQGMDGAFVAVADDATATWWNPAGLASGAFFNGIVDYGARENDDRSFGIAFGFPALGLSYYRLRISQIQAPTSTAETPASRQDQGIPGAGLFTTDLSQFGATVGQSLGDHLVVASTLKVVRADNETRGDLDLGAMASVGLFRAGVSVRNVTAPEFGDEGEAIRIDRRARAGVALMSPPVTTRIVEQVIVAFDVDLTRAPSTTGEDERRLAGGAEAWFRGRRIGVRGGVGRSAIGPARVSGAAGVSVALRPGIYLDGSTTRGADAPRRGWGIAARVTF